MFLEVNGVRLFSRRVGAGPLVVVLHGGPGASHDYLLPQYDLLAQGRSLLYYDQRGGGQSPVLRDTPVGWQEHVADLDGMRGLMPGAPDVVRVLLWGPALGAVLCRAYAARRTPLAGC